MKNIALHILDLAENSARAQALKVLISIIEDPDNDSYRLVIQDDGYGMEEAVLHNATNPFFTSRSTRKVGLGLPLVQMNAERTGGSFKLHSEPGKGTTMEADFIFSHPDRLPLGEIGEVLVLLAASLPQLRIVYEHKTPSGFYRFDTEAIREITGNIQECNLEIRRFIEEMIMENLKEIKAES
jgi:hypothetical protein